MLKRKTILHKKYNIGNCVHNYLEKFLEKPAVHKIVKKVFPQEKYAIGKIFGRIIVKEAVKCQRS